MSDFFKSEIVIDELKEINELQEFPREPVLHNSTVKVLYCRKEKNANLGSVISLGFLALLN